MVDFEGDKQYVLIHIFNIKDGTVTGDLGNKEEEDKEEKEDKDTEKSEGDREYGKNDDDEVDKDAKKFGGGTETGTGGFECN